MDEIDKYIQDQQNGVVQSTDEPMNKQEQMDSLDKVLAFIIKHPLISIALIVIPVSAIFSPLRTTVFSLIAVIFVIIVYLNAIILYLSSLVINSKNNSFSRFVWYSIPLSIIIQFLSPYGIMLPLGLFSIVLFLIIMFALDFEIGVWKTMLLSLAIYAINFIILFGIALAAESIAHA